MQGETLLRGGMTLWFDMNEWKRAKTYQQKRTDMPTFGDTQSFELIALRKQVELQSKRRDRKLILILYPK